MYTYNISTFRVYNIYLYIYTVEWLQVSQADSLARPLPLQYLTMLPLRCCARISVSSKEKTSCKQSFGAKTCCQFWFPKKNKTVLFAEDTAGSKFGV